MSTKHPHHALDKLAAQGNSVALSVQALLSTDFPSTAEGYRSAFKMAFATDNASSSLAKPPRVTALRGTKDYPQISGGNLSIGRSAPSASDLAQASQMAADASNPIKNRSIVPNAIREAAELAQIYPGNIPGTSMANMPGPLASAALLGSLGAGAGYVGSKAFNWLRGSNKRDSARLARTSALMGGMLGLAPAAGMALMNLGGGKPMLGSSSWMFDKPASENEPVYAKSASVIPVDTFQEMIWNDADITHRLPTSIIGASSALIEGAQRTGTGRNSGLPFVTPVDVARMAVGLGSGYASGILVGKALGGLFGVSDQSQKILRQSGAAAGLLRSVVPLAYGA